MPNYVIMKKYHTPKTDSTKQKDKNRYADYILYVVME